MTTGKHTNDCYGSLHSGQDRSQDESSTLIAGGLEDQQCPSRENKGNKAWDSRALNLFLLSAVLGALLLVVSRPEEFVRTLLSTLSDDNTSNSPVAMRMAATHADRALKELQSLVDKEKRRVQKANNATIALSHGSMLDEAEEPDLPTSGCEATVMIVRHCEKDTLEEHCNFAGFERAHHLATLFGPPEDRKPDDKCQCPNRGPTKWPVPNRLFALSPMRHSKKHRNYREIETVQPLADKFGLKIDSSYGQEDDGQLAKKIFRMLQSGDMCGKLIVICWKHSEIPKLAQRLGCGPTQGCPMDYWSMEFDAVWQIRYIFDVAAAFGLPRKSHRDLDSEKDQWKVFGSVQRQGFDPLHYSTQRGDYSEVGVDQGGHWMLTDP